MHTNIPLVLQGLHGADVPFWEIMHCTGGSMFVFVLFLQGTQLSWAR